MGRSFANQAPNKESHLIHQTQELPGSVLSLCNGVSDALTWYLSNWQFQANEKDIRDQLKGLERLIEQFSNALPDEFSPLGNFIHGTYTGEVFLKDGLKPDEDALIALQNAWRDQFGFVAIRDHLDVVRRYVLAARECLGGRRPLEHRKAALVRALARTWKRLTNEWPTSGRHYDNNKQTGPFADFVRIACGCLPEFCSVDPLNAAIRNACERVESQ
jgi:hypothetical protein